jgi:UDP-N-acetylmuramoyl-tripeptide--D-alanyl-D-alanine ligase
MLTLRELAAQVPHLALNGDGAVRFTSVSTDTRTLAAGALFFALRGERFDAHDFAGTAVERGAAALVVERALPLPVPQLVVADARAALGRTAAAWRMRFVLPLVAVAGSNGKTTVTQMIGAILAQACGPAGRLVTRGNLNNEIGLPLMLCELTAAHRAAVLELGMNHPGEMRMLAQIAQPTVGLVNNAQREHQEFMASVEATAEENAAVIDALPADGVAVFPADDACARIWRERAGTRRVLDFAQATSAAVTAEAALDPLGADLRVATPHGGLSLRLPVSGAHNVHNALAALTAALAIDVPLPAIVAGLEGFHPVGGRGVRTPLADGGVLIDDSYNANPDSVRAAIDLLAAQPGPRVLVLGDMGEVGAQGPAFHREVGAYARSRGVHALLTLGSESAQAVAAFGAGARHFESVAALAQAAQALAHDGGTLLVKGSRFMRMERVVVALTGATETPCGAH